MNGRDERVAERIGRNLWLTRRRVGLSQERLAELCALHRTEISLVEQGGRIPRTDTLIKLASALEVGVGELVKGIAWAAPATERPGRFAVDKPFERG